MTDHNKQPFAIIQDYIDGDDHVYTAGYAYGLDLAETKIMRWLTDAGFVLDNDYDDDDEPIHMGSDEHEVYIGEATENIYTYVVEVATPIEIGVPFSPEVIENQLVLCGALLPSGLAVDVIPRDDLGENHCDVWATARFTAHDLDGDGHEFKLIALFDAAERIGNSL